VLGEPTREIRLSFEALCPSRIGKRLPMKNPSRVLQSLRSCVSFLFGCAFALAQNPSGSGGCYTTAQAANGAKAYQRACASCHGAKLKGGMGPALVGKQFWLMYGGKKVSRLWSDVHTEMPMMAVVRQFAVPDMKRISFCLAQALRFGIAG
ncbi:MAG TPA: cytochrome c, partial [Candidatus Sulfotelmatobacter sp.]